MQVFLQFSLITQGPLNEEYISFLYNPNFCSVMQLLGVSVNFTCGGRNPDTEVVFGLGRRLARVASAGVYVGVWVCVCRGRGGRSKHAIIFERGSGLWGEISLG